MGFYAINGKGIELDVAPTVIDGRTLVPVRFIAEATGSVVIWLEDTQEVIIKYNADWGDSIYIKTVEEQLLCNETGVYAELINIADERIEEANIIVEYIDYSGEVMGSETLVIATSLEKGEGKGLYSNVFISSEYISRINFRIVSIK